MHRGSQKCTSSPAATENANQQKTASVCAQITPRQSLLHVWKDNISYWGRKTSATGGVQIAALFKRCADLGVTMLNTCEFYGADRANERLIGAAIAFSPPSFQVSLKVGAVGDIDGGLRMESTPARLKESVETAIQLLGVPCIDLVVQARQDPNTPLEDVMQCFKELVEAGAAVTSPATDPLCCCSVAPWSLRLRFCANWCGASGHRVRIRAVCVP